VEKGKGGPTAKFQHEKKQKEGGSPPIKVDEKKMEDEPASSKKE
jgi:hypothetical protein